MSTSLTKFIFKPSCDTEIEKLGNRYDYLMVNLDLKTVECSVTFISKHDYTYTATAFGMPYTG